MSAPGPSKVRTLAEGVGCALILPCGLWLLARAVRSPYDPAIQGGVAMGLIGIGLWATPFGLFRLGLAKLVPDGRVDASIAAWLALAAACLAAGAWAAWRIWPVAGSDRGELVCGSFVLAASVGVPLLIYGWGGLMTLRERREFGTTDCRPETITAAPGQEITLELDTEKAVASVTAVLEHYAEEADEPTRRIAATVQSVAKGAAGWAHRATARLPDDAGTLGSGGWIFTIEARSRNEAVLSETADVQLIG